MKPLGMKQGIYERYQSDGFTEPEIEGIWRDTLVMRGLMAKRQGQEQREITCSTYKRAQKRLNKEHDDWFNEGGRR